MLRAAEPVHLQLLNLQSQAQDMLWAWCLGAGSTTEKPHLARSLHAKEGILPIATCEEAREAAESQHSQK